MSTSFSVCLWDNSALEMPSYYQNVFEDFKLVSESPIAVVFEIAGVRIMGLTHAVPEMKFNEKISLVLTVETQKELDKYWNYFTKEGRAGQCGWLEDKYGVSWQIVPSVLGELMSNPQTIGSVSSVMMKMSKLVISELIDASK
jgi:predicted 3-demethylubiquinone-9 3-methyltransferase (glyoxalase superfamily)